MRSQWQFSLLYHQPCIPQFKYSYWIDVLEPRQAPLEVPRPHFGETLMLHQMFTVPTGDVSWCHCCCSPLIAVLLSDLGLQPSRSAALKHYVLILNRTSVAGFWGGGAAAWSEWGCGQKEHQVLIVRACLLEWKDRLYSYRCMTLTQGLKWRREIYRSVEKSRDCNAQNINSENCSCSLHWFFKTEPILIPIPLLCF